MTEKLILRSYSKAIFFLPTLVMSIIGWIFAVLCNNEPIPLIEVIWMCMFFANMFVVLFDFSSSKFVILVLVLMILSVFLYIFVFPIVFNPVFFKGDFKLILGFRSHFYIAMTAILAFCLIITAIIPYFDYYTIERNELYHRKGIFVSAERWQLSNLRFIKEIPDIFEFLMFRAGTLKFFPSESNVIILPTVLNINKKETQLDYLLSKIKVAVD